jgi:hypothetical protein
MYAYVDETGNTGNKILDSEQPLFITSAMLTRSNFDVIWDAEIARIAKKAGVKALHAAELGVGRLDLIAPHLLKIVKAAKARFYLSRVEKLYLAATKVMDTYFDSGENLAVPWQTYNLRQLRLVVTFKIATYMLTNEIAQTVWNCLLARKESTATELFVEGARALLSNVNRLPDQRSQQMIKEALEWAIANPENFSIHTKNRAFMYSHSPNYVAFTMLVDGIDEAAKAWGSPVREIVHDRQVELEKMLRFHHEIVSNASEEMFHWPGETPRALQRVPGSIMRMSTEQTSAGLQVVDVILWLFKRALATPDIGPANARLLHQVYRRGRQNDFSFEGVGTQVEERIHEVMTAPFGEEQQAASRAILAKSESNRQAAMRKYAEQKALSLNETRVRQ